MSRHRHTAPPEQDPLGELHSALQQSGAQLPELHRAAGRLRDRPANLRDSLAWLSAHEQALTEVAARSYAHELGFNKIVLRTGGGYGIRLHVWHRHGDRWQGDLSPHGHRWEFASWVVVGGLCETTYAEADHGGAPFRRHRYRRDRRGVALLTPEGMTTLRTVDRVEHPAGSVYNASRSVLHTVMPFGQELAASLVLQGPRAIAPTPVYRPPGILPDEDEKLLRPEDLRILLTEVWRAL